MTDCAEIERLLNQTGRTLEGLPEFYPEEEQQVLYREVIEKLELWENRALHQSDVIELLVGALRDALEERDYAVLRLCEQDGCEGCKHEECPHENEPCASCCRMWKYEEDDNWEFGILGEEGEADE